LLIDFDPAGAELYRFIAEDLIVQLEEAGAMFGSDFRVFAHYEGNDEGMYQAQGQIMSRLSCLNMLCCHPDLLRISAANFNDATKPRSGSTYAAFLDEAGYLDPLNKHPKLDATIELVDEILTASPENKVVLFSFYKPMLPIIEAAVGKRTKCVQFVAELRDRERDAAKERFARDPSTRLFLSNDCGGYGLDLPMANYLDSYDLPWSAGKLRQRNGRIDRLSSRFPQITLLDQQMAGSVEERQYHIVHEKIRVGEAVIDRKGVDDRGGLNLDVLTLHGFLQDSVV
jgi:SNF2 family DNA or RNA helicase